MQLFIILIDNIRIFFFCLINRYVPIYRKRFQMSVEIFYFYFNSVTLHVKEDLESRIEALICNLLPELMKLVSADLLGLQTTPSTQCIE